MRLFLAVMAAGLLDGLRTALPVLTAVLLGGLRIAGMNSPAIQAIDHLYAGGLAGAWLAGKPRNRLFLALFAALSLTESVVFIVQKVQHP